MGVLLATGATRAGDGSELMKFEQGDAGESTALWVRIHRRTVTAL